MALAFDRLKTLLDGQGIQIETPEELGPHARALLETIKAQDVEPKLERSPWAEWLGQAASRDLAIAARPTDGTVSEWKLPAQLDLILKPLSGATDRFELAGAPLGAAHVVFNLFAALGIDPRGFGTAVRAVLEKFAGQSLENDASWKDFAGLLAQARLQEENFAGRDAFVQRFEAARAQAVGQGNGADTRDRVEAEQADVTGARDARASSTAARPNAKASPSLTRLAWMVEFGRKPTKESSAEGVSASDRARAAKQTTPKAVDLFPEDTGQLVKRVAELMGLDVPAGGYARAAAALDEIMGRFDQHGGQFDRLDVCWAIYEHLRANVQDQLAGIKNMRDPRRAELGDKLARFESLGERLRAVRQEFRDQQNVPIYSGSAPSAVPAVLELLTGQALATLVQETGGATPREDSPAVPVTEQLAYFEKWFGYVLGDGTDRDVIRERITSRGLRSLDPVTIDVGGKATPLSDPALKPEQAVRGLAALLFPGKAPSPAFAKALGEILGRLTKGGNDFDLAKATLEWFEGQLGRERLELLTPRMMAIGQPQTQLVAATSAIAELRRQLGEVQKIRSILGDEVKQIEEAIASGSGDKSALEAELAKLKEKQALIDPGIEQLGTSIQRFEARIEETKAGLRKATCDLVREVHAYGENPEAWEKGAEEALEALKKPNRPESDTPVDGGGDGGRGSKSGRGPGDDGGRGAGLKGDGMANLAQERAEECSKILRDPSLSIQDKMLLFLIVFASYTDKEREKHMEEIVENDRRQADWRAREQDLEKKVQQRETALAEVETEIRKKETQLRAMGNTAPAEERQQLEGEINELTKHSAKLGDNLAKAKADKESEARDMAHETKNQDLLFLQLERISKRYEQLMQMINSLLEASDQLIQRLTR